MAKKAKLLFSSPWLTRAYLGEPWAYYRARRWFDLCAEALALHFAIPATTKGVRLHLYDRRDNADCVMFRLKEQWHTMGLSGRRLVVCFTASSTASPRGALSCATELALRAAPLGWKDGKATVWAEIEYR